MIRDKVDPPSAVGGLEGIDRRVGIWGKKKQVKHMDLRSMETGSSWIMAIIMALIASI